MRRTILFVLLVFLAACQTGNGFGKILGSAESDYAEDVALYGNTAVVVAKSDGVKLYDVTTPSAITEIKVIFTQDQAFNVAIKDNYAFVADYTGGIQVIDLTTPASASIVASKETSGTAIDIAIRGNVAFVGEGGGTIESFNIADVSAISLINTYQVENQAITTIDANDDYIFVGNASGDLFVLARERVEVPQAEGAEPLADGLINEREDWVALVNSEDADTTNDQTTYVTVSDRQVDTAWPVSLVSQESNTYATTVLVVGPAQSVSKTIQSKSMILKSIAKADYADPGTPSGEAWGLDIHLNGDTLFYSDWGAGLAVLNIADPTALAVHTVYTDSNAYYDSTVMENMTIRGTLYSRVVVAANAQGGLAVLDATDLTDLSPISGANIDINLEMGDSAHGVAVDSSRGIAFVADNSQQRLIAVQLTD